MSLSNSDFSETACLYDCTVRQALGMRVQWFNVATGRRRTGRIVGIFAHVVHIKPCRGPVVRSNWGYTYLPKAVVAVTAEKPKP